MVKRPEFCLTQKYFIVKELLNRKTSQKFFCCRCLFIAQTNARRIAYTSVDH